MNIDIILEGKLKEPCFKIGVEEFKKRLLGYVNLRIIEVSDIKEYAANFKKNYFIIALEINGNTLSSVEF
ncbi:MAG: 23S rRNA (pseudouridine(1915)-N(3))-methyltransferase RlmH, partial [Candidatus Gastranaerophilales bacterium]|nr:23S rRNA (pseudouridine(1915)-N(3))-methyltransferase RlmH [Candidatus Gastranaerophilales bacterium]